MTNRKKARPGAAAVEAAVLLPFVALMFIGVIDFSRAFYYSLTLAECARNGAAYERDPLLKPESPYKDVGEAARAGTADLGTPVEVTSVTGADAGGPYVEVSVSCRFTLVVSGFPGIPDPLSLRRTVRMRQAPSVPN